jgi:D-alanine-D-alanine ligase
MHLRMRIGITYDLKSDAPFGAHQPDDFQEEYDSPATLEALASVLRSLGHFVDMLGDGRELLEKLLHNPPDLVFNIAEGQGVGRCREARVPAVLEMLGIPHTGSDPLTLAVTLDKECAKRLVRSTGVEVPRGLVVDAGELDRLDARQLGKRLQLEACRIPLIVKPAWEGSSKGIRGRCVVDSLEQLIAPMQSLARDQRQPILVEEFIDGEELTVGVVGNTRPEIIGVMRIKPVAPVGRFVYSLEVKRDYECHVRYESPPDIEPNALAAVRQAALAVYRVLGCRDVARVDFRLRQGVPYFLEVNPLPGINPQTSDLVILAGLCGWSYSQLIARILQAALDRYPGLASRGTMAS